MVAGFATVTMAQTTGTGSNGGTTSTIGAATAEAKILVPIILTWDGTKLNYGEVVVITVASPGSVLMYPDGTGTPAFSAWTNCNASGSGVAPHTPVFTVAGSISTAYTITLPSTDITLTNTANAGVILLNTFKVWETALSASNSLSTTLSATGTGTFTLGAKLNFLAAQSSGIYVGTYPVFVDYN